MVTKQVLNQYYDLLKETDEVKKKIKSLEEAIPRIEKRIAEIEAGETVKDKVRGGAGGMQSFTIEGIPTKEYYDKKMELCTKKNLLESRKKTLKAMELEILRQIKEIEEFIRSLPDAHMRRIVTLRVIDKLSWNEVADAIGGGNTEDSVRMMYNRCFK